MTILEMNEYYMYWNIEKNKSRRAYCIGSSLPMTILEMNKYYMYWNIEKNKNKTSTLCWVFIALNSYSSSPTKILEMHQHYTYWNIGILENTNLDEHIVLGLHC